MTRKLPGTRRSRRIAGAAGLAGLAVAALTALAIPSSAQTTNASSVSAVAGTSVGRCTTGDLSIGIVIGVGGNSAGHANYPIQYVNVSGHTCDLYGYPGISVTTASGAQIGLPAARGSSSAPRVVTLAPNAAARSDLQVADTGDYSPSACRPVTGVLIRDYPPGSFSSTVIPYPIKTCAGTSVRTLSTGPVVAGAGAPGRP
jgi:hypothetical protein